LKISIPLLSFALPSDTVSEPFFNSFAMSFSFVSLMVNRTVFCCRHLLRWRNHNTAKLEIHSTKILVSLIDWLLVRVEGRYVKKIDVVKVRPEQTEFHQSKPLDTLSFTRANQTELHQSEARYGVTSILNLVETEVQQGFTM